MKPAPFDYVRPASIDEALEHLSDDQVEVKPLAGGQSLVPMMNFRLARPELLVDLNTVAELSYIRRSDGVLHIGAMTRQAALERSSVVAREWPLLASALKWVAHPQIRNRGTIGGSLAHADPAAELPVVMTTLDAVLVAQSSRGKRSIAARDFFVSNLITSLEPDELLVEIQVPAMPSGAATAFLEYARRHGDFALGGAAISLAIERGSVVGAAVGLLAAAPVPMRAVAAEQALLGCHVREIATDEAARTAVEGLTPTGDIHGDQEYRRGLIEVLVRRGLEQALGEDR